MAFEGLDAGILIETAGFVPHVQVPETRESDREPTLDAALKQTERTERGDTPSRDTRLTQEEKREATMLDLWVRGTGHAALVALKIGDEATAGGELASGAMAIASDPVAPEGDPLMTKRLDPQFGHYLSSQYDSTDYHWEEMSTGDYEWLVSGVTQTQNARNDIADILATSSSVEEAQQRINEYLEAHGWTDAVEVYDANNPDEDVEIEVTGSPPPPPPIYNFDLSGGDFEQSGGTPSVSGLTFNSSPVPDTNPDGPDVAIEVLSEANRANVEASATKLRAKIEILDAKYASLSNIQTFVMKDGTVVTGAEMKAWWEGIDFRVTDQIFPTGMGGAVRNGVSVMNWQTVNGWDAWAPNGLIFIILHEMVHASPYGERIRDASHAMHVLFGGTTTDYDSSDFWWDANEENSNWGAREIMTGLGISVPTQTPPHGYDGSLPSAQPPSPPAPPPSPPPPPPPGGGGGGGDVGEF